MNIFNYIHIHTTEHIPAYGFHGLLLLYWASMWCFNCISGLCTSLCGLPNLWCWSGNSRWRWGNEQDYIVVWSILWYLLEVDANQIKLCVRDIFLSRNIEHHLQHCNAYIRDLTNELRANSYKRLRHHLQPKILNNRFVSLSSYLFILLIFTQCGISSSTWIPNNRPFKCESCPFSITFSFSSTFSSIFSLSLIPFVTLW